MSTQVNLQPVTVNVSALSSKAADSAGNGRDDAPAPMPESITKRDGRIVDFDPVRIERAVRRCFGAIGATPPIDPQEITRQIVNVVAAQYPQPTVENIQDVVELVLQANGQYAAAKAYILYRAEHARLRQERAVPAEVRDAFADADQYFPTPIQQFQFYDKYSRFNYDLGRRETWVETVDRAVSYLRELSRSLLPEADYQRIHESILRMGAMPSMRLLAMAGDPARRNNVAIYNCSYLPVDSTDSFVEALVISMAGCGVGYSVERRYVEQLPRIKRQTGVRRLPFIVPDTTEGWADALRAGFSAWFDGEDIEFDMSEIRPAGAPLRVKGGRASGPEPLRQVLRFARERILARQGGFITTVDAHDIMCAVGGAAISGGVRRTAMISLFDYDDPDMRHCKDGDFWVQNNQRWNANNSAVWPDRELTQEEVSRFVLDMVASGGGEPGIFNRRAALSSRPERRAEAEFGTNPCGEIILRPYQFCNLTSAVARADDTYETLRDKVEVATIIGTIQSMATDFPGLRPIWKQNCEEERLLGVDLNGQLDSTVCQDEMVQRRLKDVVLETNARYADLLGIPRSAATTCVKPSGNSSQLLNSSSGLHPRWARHYVRNIRVSSHSPVYRVLRDAGAPMDPENGQTRDDATTWVVHFPVKAPDGSIVRNDRTALEQCEYWLQNKLAYTEHNPSVTITYRPHEVFDVMRWIWEHQDRIGGMAFLPASDANYQQMPYEEISRTEFDERAAAFPPIDFSKIYRYEETDLTTAAQELACLAGACET
ncbi:MAG: recombinase [Spirochaetaceae bacterium]|nr:MAG: recombinase [Spirochaetaceae bacterium]